MAAQKRKRIGYVHSQRLGSTPMLVLRFGSDLAKCPGDDKRRPRKDQKDHKCRTGGVRYDYFVGGNFGRLVFELISLFVLPPSFLIRSVLLLSPTSHTQIFSVWIDNEAFKSNTRPTSPRTQPPSILDESHFVLPHTLCAIQTISPFLLPLNLLSLSGTYFTLAHL